MLCFIVCFCHSFHFCRRTGTGVKMKLSIHHVFKHEKPWVMWHRTGAFKHNKFSWTKCCLHELSNEKLLFIICCACDSLCMCQTISIPVWTVNWRQVQTVHVEATRKPTAMQALPCTATKSSHWHPSHHGLRQICTATCCRLVVLHPVTSAQYVPELWKQIWKMS